jgi:hypothetical protein
MLLLVLLAAAGLALAGRGLVLDLRLERRRALPPHLTGLAGVLAAAACAGLADATWEPLGFAGVCALMAGVALGRSAYLAAGGAAASLWLAASVSGSGLWLGAAAGIAALGLLVTGVLLLLQARRGPLRRYALVPLGAEA